MEKRILIAGFGGQGVLSLGQFIAYCAINKGWEATWLPSYGPEMRGGTSNCSVVVSDGVIASPLANEPDCLIVLNKPSFRKYEGALKCGGLMITEKSVAESVGGMRNDVKAITIDAEALAAQAGNLKSANIALFGAFCKLTGWFSKEEAQETVAKKFAAKPAYLPSNLKALELGFGAVN